MVLSWIWLSFILVAFIVALAKLIFLQDYEIFPKIVASLFDMSKIGFEISLGLTGVLTLFMGFMKIGEAGGVVRLMARMVQPFFQRIFPEIPKGHPVYGTMVMNFAANMLGLDNAATPAGLKAMGQLQELNADKETASNSQIMFLVLNTSGLTLIPVSVMTIRQAQGAANPTDVFIPILLTTFFSTLAGLIAVSLIQRINLLKPVVFAYLLSISAVVAGLLFAVTKMANSQVEIFSQNLASILLLGILVTFVAFGIRSKINVYESFIEGAKEGFQTAVRIIPYLVAMLVAIGAFRASGALDYLLQGVNNVAGMLGFAGQWVEGLPTAIMKPLSGSGARGMMVEAIDTHGVDSYIGRLVSTFQGATDTTFYIIAVYFGSVGIRNTRYAISAGLIADGTAIIAGIFIANIFWG